MKKANRIKTLLCILALVFSISCKEENTNLFSKNYIKQLLTIVPGTEIYTNTDILFVKTTRGSLGTTDIIHLLGIFNRNYKNEYKDFEFFLFQALNQKIVFKDEFFNQRNAVKFIIDKKLENKYLASGTTHLLKEYLKKSKKSYILKNQNLSNNEIYTLLYYFYLNDYHVTFDDAIGIYEIWPIKKGSI